MSEVPLHRAEGLGACILAFAEVRNHERKQEGNSFTRGVVENTPERACVCVNGEAMYRLKLRLVSPSGCALK